MRRITGTLLAGTALGAGAPAFAQPSGPGWNIVWGAQSVPLGPWTTAIIAIALAAAAYGFLRKGSRGGTAAVLAAVALGGAYVAEDVNAVLSPDLTINEPSGSEFVACPVRRSTAEDQGVEFPQIIVGTTIDRGISLTALEFVAGDDPQNRVDQQAA